jgi:hypothetical protein
MRNDGDRSSIVSTFFSSSSTTRKENIASSNIKNFISKTMTIQIEICAQLLRGKID